MNKQKRGWLVLVLSLCVVGIGVILYYIGLSNKRNDFENLLKKDMILKVDLGIIERKHILKEKNALFKKVYRDNYTYLYITKDNILFSYYLDWYYSFDPMQGIHKDYQTELNEQTKNNIMNSIKEKLITSLKYKNENDYVTVTIDDDISYIAKIELQYILQENDVMLPIYSLN